MKNFPFFKYKAMSSTILILMFGWITIPALQAQLSIDATVYPALCTSNGSIYATATGGSGSYNYKLICPTSIDTISSTTGDFPLLAPCAYTLIVSDASNGLTAAEP